MGMTGFICQDSYLAKTVKLTDEEVGRLFRALMKYHAEGIDTALEGRESIAFDFIKEDIDRAEEAYEKKCEQNRANRKGNAQPITTDNVRQRPSTPVNNRNDKKKEQEQLFEQFWKAYPKKQSKPQAMKAFLKLNPDNELLAKMLDAINTQRNTAQWLENSGQYIPYPATWLNGRRWEDEPNNPVKPVAAQNFNQRDYSSVDDELMSDLAKDMEAFKKERA